MSIILMSEVGGKPSILLMKMVVITSMVVRFTLKAADTVESTRIEPFLGENRVILD